MSDHEQIDKIKSKIDLADLISATCELDKDGRGAHENKHESDSGNCLAVYTDNGTQKWKCYHKGCEAGGDCFDWIADRDNLDPVKDFPQILEIAAEYAGIELDTGERKRVFELLTAAAEHFHSNLINEMYEDIQERWGITRETVDKLKIGMSKLDSSLEEYLRKQGFTFDECLQSGLFSGKTRLYPFYKGRYVFPYWVRGEVRYMIGRATNKTQNTKWEKTKKGEFIKYKKLRTHTKKAEYISKYVRNDVMYGADSLWEIGGDFCIITEGITDAIMAIQSGFPCVSPVTTQFRQKDHEPILRLVRSVKRVYTCMDNEKSEAGLAGAHATCKHLLDNGVDASIVELPRPDGVDKIDLADYLRDHGADSFRNLLSLAYKPKPETPVTGATQTDESIPYGIEDGCFVKYEQAKDRHGEWITKTRILCNFTIDLQTDTKSDDGIASERWWAGDILANGHRIPFKDEARKFVTPSDHARVLATAGGSALVFENRNLQDIRHAMQEISTPVCRNIRQTFGLLDTYTYETPSVMIDRDGVHPTETRDIDLSGKGNSKHLDMQVLTDAEFRAVGKHIRDDLMNLHTRYIIDSLTGFTFLAPFGSELIHTTGWTGDHIGLFLIGTTGSGKSFDAIMFQWFFGDFSTNGAITSWTATPNELQVAGYYFRDSVYLVDDFKLSHFKGNLSRYSAVIGILQNYTDGTARDRLTSDIKIREGQPIRGALIATGEDFPHNEASVEGRYHVVHVSGGGSREAGHLCLKNRHLYNGFMARYIAWVFQKDNYAADIVTRIDAHRELFIGGRKDATNIDRLAQSFAYNLTGYEWFCNFMLDSGFVDTDTAHTMIDAHRAELNANIDGALDAITSATAGMMYLEILSELIASGRFKILDWEDKHKVYNEEYDRDDPESEEYVVEDLPLEDLPFCIGFDDEPDDPYLYIIPNIAYAEVCRVAATQGMPFTHTQTGTGKELIASGVMMEGKGDGIAYAKWYQERTRKVWKIAKHALNYERVTEYTQMGLEDIMR